MVAAAPVSPALQSSLAPNPGTAGVTGTPTPSATYSGPGAAGYGPYSNTPTVAQQNAAPPNPYQKYIDAYTASLANSRAGIEQMLHQSMGELQGRRDAASQVVAGLPEQVAAAYNTAAGGMQGNIGAATSALSPDVKGDAAAYGAPLMGALAQDKAGADAAAPFLNLAVRANYDSGQNQLENTAFQANQQVDQQQQQFQQQLALQQAQIQAQAQQTKAQENDPNNPNSIPGQLKILNAKDTAAAAAQPAAGLEANTGMTQGQVNAAKADPKFQHIVTAMTTKGVGKNGASIDPGILYKELTNGTAQDRAILQVLIQEHPAFFYAVDKNGAPTTTQLNSNLVSNKHSAWDEKGGASLAAGYRQLF